MTNRPERYTYLDADQAARVAAWLAAAMERAGIDSQAALIKRARSSQPTVQPLLAGTPKRYWTSSLRAVSRAVGRRPDALERVAKGLDAEEVIDLEAMDRIAVVERSLDQLREEIAELAGHAEEFTRLAAEVRRRLALEPPPGNGAQP